MMVIIIAKECENREPTRKLLIKTTNYTNLHESVFIETKTLKTLTLYVLGFSALCDARHLFFL